MGILNNGFRDSYGCFRYAGAGVSGGAAPSAIVQNFHMTGANRNMINASNAGVSQTSGVPNGHRPPSAWVMPQKSGGLSSRYNITGSGSVAAAGQAGRNMDGTIAGSGGVDSSLTFLGLIVTIAATLGQVTGAGGISSATMSAISSLIATISGTSSVTATAAGLADLVAMLEGEGFVVPNNTALMDIGATLRGYSDLTPEGLRDAVWNAILTNYPDTGTAGNTLSLAGSGGVDYDTLATAVWTRAIRELSASGNSAAAAAVVAAATSTPIHANVKEVNDVAVTGTGTQGDEWGPV